MHIGSGRLIINGYLALTYLLLLNIFAFLAIGYDKKKAAAGGRRVPEKTLLSLAFAGGAVGVYIGMKRFRHKTKKLVFSLGIPVFAVLNVLALYYINEILDLF